MLQENGYFPRVDAQEGEPIESIGQRSIRELRQDLRGAVMTSYAPLAQISPEMFMDRALETMYRVRPREAEALESLSQEVRYRVSKASDKESTKKRSVWNSQRRRSHLLTVIAGNELNLMIEAHISGHPMLIEDEIAIHDGVGGVLFVPRGSVDADGEYSAESSVTRIDEVSYVHGEEDTALVHAIHDLLNVTGRPLLEQNVNAIFFTRQHGIGSGAFYPGLKSIVIGIGVDDDGSSAPLSVAQVLEIYGVVVHERKHGLQHVDGLTDFPSVVNELAAFYASFIAHNLLPYAQVRRLESEFTGSTEDQISQVKWESLETYTSFQSLLHDPDPKRSFFTDHNIFDTQVASDAAAQGIHEELFPK
ncbi:MAG: hypothetical protein RLZZ455_50 [Candidatus Parcubacteria bacterium]|jgi:hypothetical protein